MSKDSKFLHLSFQKGGAKSGFLERECHKTASNGQYDLKYCMQGAFMGYY